MSAGDLAGRVALITGGASGIGAATAAAMRTRGAEVAVLDLRRGEDESIFAVECDVGDDESVAHAVTSCMERFGHLDVVVNNAGIGAQGTVADNSSSQWSEVINVNLIGMVRVTRAALPHLVASDAGVVVNVGSIAGWAGIPQRALYSASKGAVHALTLAMAADHVGEGIRVNAVAPGTADTPWVGRLLDAATDPEAERTALAARQPMGRLVSADEVANAVCYLASPSSGSTTGTILAVDGGMAGLRTRPPS